MNIEQLEADFNNGRVINLQAWYRDGRRNYSK